jgi:hypothetical protein
MEGLQAEKNSDPEVPYLDEPLGDVEWLAQYNQEAEGAERRNQMLQNCFDWTEWLETW